MKDKNKKRLENLIASFGMGHAVICPIHGVLPKLTLIGGAGSFLSETKLGKAGAWIHEKEEEGLAYIISKFHDSHEDHHHEYHSTTEDHSHENRYSEEVLNQAHIGVSVFNYLMLAYSLYIIGKRFFPKAKGLYNKVASKYGSYEHN